MSTSDRKASIRRLYEEAWSQGQFDVLDTLFAHTYQSAVPGLPPGPAGEQQHIATIRSTYPDLHMTVDEMVVTDDAVATRWTMVGTDQGGFMGKPPTLRSVRFWGVHFFQFRSGRIGSCWTGIDMLGMLSQLGVVPSPWDPGAD